jgi:hypothetical protein
VILTLTGVFTEGVSWEGNNSRFNIDSPCVNMYGYFLPAVCSGVSHWTDVPFSVVVNDNVDNDTTYTFATGASNGTISVTPLGG